MTEKLYSPRRYEEHGHLAMAYNDDHPNAFFVQGNEVPLSAVEAFVVRGMGKLNIWKLVAWISDVTAPVGKGKWHTYEIVLCDPWMYPDQGDGR